LSAGRLRQLTQIKVRRAGPARGRAAHQGLHREEDLHRLPQSVAHALPPMEQNIGAPKVAQSK